MAFVLPDLVIESVIREGIIFLRANPEYIDNIFQSLTASYLSNKYGSAEIEKIKTIFDKSLAVVHSHHLANAHDHCISIQLGNDVESQRQAHLDDYEDMVEVPITDVDELEALIKIEDIFITSYDSTSGIISVDLSTDLTLAHSNQLFVDAADAEHTILSVVNTDDVKQILVASGSDVNTSDVALIKSAIDYELFEQRGVIGDQKLLIGIHSKDALTAKYLYMLIKFLLLSRKQDLINRNFIVSSYQGSDFTRNIQYQGDIRFTRFLTLTGKVEDNWRADEVLPIDNIDVIVEVPADVATTEDLDKVDSTIKVSE